MSQSKIYLIRYNTKSDGENKVWRIVEEATGIETLADTFRITGTLRPQSSVENGVKKWNVSVRGVGEFLTSEAGYVMFLCKNEGI